MKEAIRQKESGAEKMCKTQSEKNKARNWVFYHERS